MNRFLKVLSVYLLLSSPVWAQQVPSFTHYVFTPLWYNPAAAGLENQLRIDGLFRYQYLGYQATTDAGGSPVTQFFSASMPVASLKSGVGLTFMNDLTGGKRINRNIGVSYAYHLPLGQNRLSFGVSAGLHALQLTGDTYRPRDPNDPVLPEGNVTKVAPDFGVGVNFSSATYTLGVGAKHLTQPAFAFTNTPSSPLKRTYFLHGSATLGISYAFDITPMLLLKTDMARFWPEVGAMATYNSQFFGGFNYRLQEGASVLAGARLLQNKLRLSYSLDWVTYRSDAKSQTSHELMLSYSLPSLKAGKKSIIRTPRYSF